MMVATFNGYPCTAIIFLQPHLVHSIPKHNVLITGRDMNAQIGKNVSHKFILHNSSNRNVQYLTDFTQENRLPCINSNFQKSEGKLNTKSQIDDVFIN